MDKARRCLARGLAYLYVYSRKYKYAILTMAVILFFISPSIAYELQENVQAKVYAAIPVKVSEKLQLASDNYIDGWLYVMVDPGHGGDDPGCNFGEVMEKDINMQIAKRVAILLERHNAKVVYARTGDSTVDKYDRIRYANRENVDIYISIHCNSLERGTMQGIETYWGPWKREGQFLATAVHNATVKSSNAPSLLLSSKEFAVVRHTKMASALIEVGYLSDIDERRKLMSGGYQQNLADGIVEGILEFAESYLGKTEPE